MKGGGEVHIINFCFFLKRELSGVLSSDSPTLMPEWFQLFGSVSSNSLYNTTFPIRSVVSNLFNKVYSLLPKLFCQMWHRSDAA